MPLKLRFGRFELQVRLVLILLLVFLGILDLLNLYLLSRARDALEESERERTRLRVEILADSLDRGVLLDTLSSPESASRLTSTLLRRTAVRLSYLRVAVLDRAGREVVASGPARGYRAAGYTDLSESRRAALAAGRPVTSDVVPDSGGEDARLTAYAPVLDSDGRLLGLVEAIQPVPQLGALVRSFRRVIAVQVVGVLVIAGTVLFFAHWVSRPYRRLVKAVGEAGLTRPAADASPPEPDELAAALRGMVSKLKDQEETLGTLTREGGGLGDAVRFANKAARDMSTGVLVADRQAVVAALNPAAASLLGCDEKGARGRPLAEVASGVEELTERVLHCLETGTGASREVLAVIDGKGRTGHLGVSVSPAAGWDGSVAGVLVLMTDLTEIRHLQEQARLRENLASVGKISAGIAHEFRNALGTILGYARMLEKRDDPRVRGPAREILREVESVRAAVDEFLLYARPPEPARGPVSVGKILRHCAAATDDRVTVELDGEFGDVLADEGLLRRAFDNLIRNAADAAAEVGRSGRVRIVGERLRPGHVLRVDVEDDGPGVPAEIRDEIFDPFFTTRARGTGLGLALVQRTVVDLGGSIELRQSTSGGARFRLLLPLAETDSSVG